jgi:chromatin segregation and condensation protein Rec8/ScpA/Scc1 (kleisin family)
MSLVVNHLLFHKAMIGIDTDKINQYVKIAGEASSTTEVSTIEDPFTRSVTLLFMLVKEHGLDPWSLDLKHLIIEYQKYAVNSDDLDLPLAGSVLGWAWDVLKMRANGAILATEPIPEPQPEWIDFDFGWEPTFAEQLDDCIEPPIEESVLFRGERRVTLMELVGALEDARNIEVERKARLERRKELREARKLVLSEIAERLGENLHSDDPTQYKEQVWQRINEFNGKPIPIGDLLDRPEKASIVRTFVGSLFLAREGRIDIIQKDLESHSIYVKNLESAG